MPARPLPRFSTGSRASFADHDALVTDDRRLTFAELRAEVRQAAAAMIDLRRAARGPGRDLGAEHLALGGRVPGHRTTPAACSCR